MLVVTRHTALVELLLERGIISKETPILAHIQDPSVLDGQHVIGVLPTHLAARTACVTEVPLNIAPELRGVELSLEQLRQFAGEPRTYKVQEVFTGRQQGAKIGEKVLATVRKFRLGRGCP
jgi:putative CRISPR-associated protein (TIGR02620 family)